jgi:hypothetical protein
MRFVWLLFAAAVLAACSEASASRVDERTFQIEGPGIPGGSDAPNKRLASRMCPHGYRVLDSARHQGGPDRASYMPGDSGSTTVWTIRCL